MIMGKTLKRKDIYAHDYGPHSDSGEANFSRPKKSDINNILRNINYYIKNDHYSDLQSLLHSDFILQVINSVHRDRYDSPFGGTEITEYMYYEAQPVIEFLFFQHREKLIAILEDVIKKGQSASRCAEVIIRCMGESDLEVFGRQWDDSLRQKIFQHLDELYLYGKKLIAQKIAKGQVALDLVDSLNKDLAKIEGKSSLLENVYEKINFVIKLHSKDTIFNQHRIYSKVVGINAGLALLGGGVGYGVAGGIHYCKTGRFGFFNQTTTEENIENIHLEFDPEKKLIC